MPTSCNNISPGTCDEKPSEAYKTHTARLQTGYEGHAAAQCLMQSLTCCWDMLGTSKQPKSHADTDESSAVSCLLNVSTLHEVHHHCHFADCSIEPVLGVTADIACLLVVNEK